MEVIILGTGYRKSVTDGKTRNDANYIIKIGDKTYVFDLGMGAFKHALEYTGDSLKIDGAFFTHTHNDHTAGLYDLTYDVIGQYKSGEREAKDFKIYSSEAIRNLISFIHSPVYNCSTENEYTEELFDSAVDFVNVDSKDNKEFLIGDVSGDRAQVLTTDIVKNGKAKDSIFLVKPYKMDHGDDRLSVYGFTFTSLNGYTVGFTADSRYCESVENIVKESDYIFIDMARSGKNEEGKNYTHMNYEDVISLVERYPNKIFIPIHTSNPTYAMTRELEKKYINILAVKDDDVIEFGESGFKKINSQGSSYKENGKIL